MRPLVGIEKRPNGWAVVMRSGRVEYFNSNYAKVVGVEDYLTNWRRSAADAVDAMDAGPLNLTTHADASARNRS